MQYLVKFTKEYNPAILAQNLLRNTNMQYQVNLVGIQTCNTWSNLLRNPSMQYLVKFTKEYKHAIPGQIY